MKDYLKRKFSSSYCNTVAIRLVIRGKKLFFLRKSQPLRENCLVGVSPDGEGKRIVLEPDADGGYDLSTLDHTDQVITLCRHIPDTDKYSPYIRVPITFKARDICFHNTPAMIYNTDRLKRIATDKTHLQHWLQPTDFFQSDEEPIKKLAAKLAEKCSWDDYIKVMVVYEYVAGYLFYDYDHCCPLKIATRSLK